MGKISNDNSREFLKQVDDFVLWCKDNFLNLNVKKTKEMVIDFRRNNSIPDPLVIANEQVERVNEYKYLGVIIDNKLTGSANTSKLYKKCKQRIHFLRVLKNIHVDKSILTLFYKAVIESILGFAIPVWYGSLTCQDKNKLKKIVKTAGKLKARTECLDEVYNTMVIKQLRKIMNDVQHPLHCQYNFLRSGKRLALPKLQTSRFRNSFIPMSIKIFNSSAPR